MMEVIVQICEAFGPTVSEKKKTAEVVCMAAAHSSPEAMDVEAAGKRYRQTHSFIYNLEGCPSPRENVRFGCASGGTNENPYDRPGVVVHLDIKVGMAKAETIETLLCGCVTNMNYQPRKHATKKLITVDYHQWKDHRGRDGARDDRM